MASNQEKAKRKRAEEQERLLAQVPEGTRRVQVKDEKGKVRWRELDNLADLDVIQTKKDGSPVIMKGKPGRRDFASKTGPANVVVAKIMAQKEEHLKTDKLLQLVQKAPESHDVLQQAMVGLAEEAGSIAFERREAERQGDPTSQLSSRRINAIKAVVDTWLRRKDQIVSKEIDMESPTFQTILGFVMETFRGAMSDASVSEDMIKVVFSRLAKKVGSEEWKSEAKNRMKRNV
jgi:hypothetical protein